MVAPHQKDAQFKHTREQNAFPLHVGTRKGGGTNYVGSTYTAGSNNGPMLDPDAYHTHKCGYHNPHSNLKFWVVVHG